MDKYKALQLEKILKGNEFNGFKVTKFINNGKSAAVFKAVDKNGNPLALKIFDNELIERFGHEIQETRIKQEIGLRNHCIPGLISILDGGKHQFGDDNLYYIIMEFIDGMNLKDYIQQSTYDNGFIKKVVKTLHSVTEDLIQKCNIAHRDIKPENIMVDESGDIVLMDLGVLKFINSTSFSDEGEKQFVGTLRYAPPEFLTRNEEDSIAGWRAVNLYQIGAVMHDLIMKKELFYDRSPYPNLVLAIKEDAPNISNPDVSYSTNQLARDLLTKDWRDRLNVCSKEKVEQYFLHEHTSTGLDANLEKLFNRGATSKSMIVEIDKIRRSNADKEVIRAKTSLRLEGLVARCLDIFKTKKIITGYSIFTSFKTPVVHQTQASFYIPPVIYRYKEDTKSNDVERTIVYNLEGEETLGFIVPMYLLVRLVNDENSSGSISIGIILDPETQRHRNNEFFKDVVSKFGVKDSEDRSAFIFTLETYRVFEGTLSLDKDIQFEENLVYRIFPLLERVLNTLMPEYEKELEVWAEAERNGSNGYSMVNPYKRKATFFNSISGAIADYYAP
ncbi:MAG: hypothetical protein EOP56_11710 [Sphingobacteriales bacterium]|nr:MAG: hypothetical protein EOP56_11710 [Sphingobacteriales bacterium]